MPPSSRVTRLRSGAAVSWIFLPVATEPVKEILRMSGCSQIHLPQVIAAREHIEDSRRQRVAQNLSHLETGERRVGGGLQHQGVARQQCRGNLPGSENHREVPGGNRAHHAEGLAVQFDAQFVVVLQHLVFERQARGETKPRGRAHHFAHRGFKRFSLFPGKDLGEFARGGLQCLAAGTQGRAAGGFVFAPAAKGRMGAGDGVVQLCCRGVGAGGEGFARGGVDDIALGLGGGRLAVDRERKFRHG